MNRKKIEKLLEMSRKIALDELIMISGVNEDEIDIIISELKAEKLIKIENEMIFYLGGFKPKTKENKQPKHKEKEEVSYSSWDEDGIPLWARERFLIYKKMFNDAKELTISNKLTLFIEKFCMANNLEIVAGSRFIRLRDEFFEKGEDYFLKNIILKPLHGLEINNKIYSYYKEAYLDLSKPIPQNALITAKKRFLKLYPEYSKTTFAPPAEFIKKLHKEYAQGEITYYRNSVLLEEKVPQVKVKRESYSKNHIVCEFKEKPEIINCLLSDIVSDLQEVLIKHSELYTCNKIIQGSKYKFTSNNEYQLSKEFNPDKFLDYFVILSYIQAQKGKKDGFTLSSTNEIIFFIGKALKKETRQNSGAKVRQVIMQELEILSNTCFLNKDKFEPVIELIKADENMHQEFNFYFKINPLILKDKHFIPVNLLKLNPRYYIKAKRLGYYLDSLWQKKIFLKLLCINDITEYIKLKCLDSTDAKEYRMRVETVFNMLKKMNIINSWYYYDWQESRKRGWLKKWQSSHVVIEPNLGAIENYSDTDDIINFNINQLLEFITNLGMAKKNIIKELPVTRFVFDKINKQKPIGKESLLNLKAYCELKENLNGRA